MGDDAEMTSSPPAGTDGEPTQQSASQAPPAHDDGLHSASTAEEGIDLTTESVSAPSTEALEGVESIASGEAQEEARDQGSPPAQQEVVPPTPAPQPAGHRQAAPSIGNAASLFAATDDDFFGSAGGPVGSGATPTVGQVGEDDAFFAGSQHTPTQRILDLGPDPSRTTPTASSGATAAAPSSVIEPDTSASLFAESGADDDWLGVGNGTATATATSTVNGYDQTGYSSDANTSWDYSTGQTDYSAYYDQQQAGQYSDYSGYDPSSTASLQPQHGYHDQSTASYGTTYDAQGYDASQSGAAGYQSHDIYQPQYTYEQQGQDYSQTSAPASTEYDYSQQSYDYSQQGYDYSQQGYDNSAASYAQPTQQQQYDYGSQAQQQPDDYSGYGQNHSADPSAYAVGGQSADDQYAPYPSVQDANAPQPQQDTSSYASFQQGYPANGDYAQSTYEPQPQQDDNPYAPSQKNYSSHGLYQQTSNYAPEPRQDYGPSSTSQPVSQSQADPYATQYVQGGSDAYAPSQQSYSASTSYDQWSAEATQSQYDVDPYASAQQDHASSDTYDRRSSSDPHQTVDTVKASTPVGEDESRTVYGGNLGDLDASAANQDPTRPSEGPEWFDNESRAVDANQPSQTFDPYGPTAPASTSGEALGPEDTDSSSKARGDGEEASDARQTDTGQYDAGQSTGLAVDPANEGEDLVANVERLALDTREPAELADPEDGQLDSTSARYGPPSSGYQLQQSSFGSLYAPSTDYGPSGQRQASEETEMGGSTAEPEPTSRYAPVEPFERVNHQYAASMTPSRSSTGPYSPAGPYNASSATYSPEGSGGDVGPGQYAPFAAERAGSDLFGAKEAPASPYQPGSAVFDTYPASTATSMHDIASRNSEAAAMPDAAEERRRLRIPCVTFGVDGKVVTYFPNAAASSALGSEGVAPMFGGYGATSSSSQVQVRSLRSLVAASSYATVFNPETFPGPLLEAGGGGSSSSSRGGSGGKHASKKAAIVAHLRERADEISAGAQYLARGDASGARTGGEQRSADRALLFRLLALIVEHDGKVVDNPKFDEATRQLLTVDRQDAMSAYNSAVASPAATVATYELTHDFLDKLQTMLVNGQRREAVQLAVDRRMWAHAMVIASGLDKETWCRVVIEFMAFELDNDNLANDHNVANGQAQKAGKMKALRTAYSLFSGQNASQVYDVFRPKVSLSASPNTPSAAHAAAGWTESVAAVIANRSAGDSGLLTAMGDGLLLSEHIEAAHICYLLSPQTAVFGGVDTPGSRATLLGGHSPRASILYLRDLDSILLSEVYEFAQSLAPTVKGQEAFSGLPYLQPFRLVHAMTLAELGDTAGAQRYCEAIAATFKSSKPSPYLHPTLLAQLKEFTVRLAGSDNSSAVSSGSWMAKKMQKPTLDGVWGALEGRVAKFIAGEEGADGSQPSTQPPSKSSSHQGIPVGPFSHFSSITAEAAGATPNHAGLPNHPASRAGSAMDFRMYRSESPAARAASALSMRPVNQLAPTTPLPPMPHSSAWAGSSMSASQAKFMTNTASSTYGGYGYGAEVEGGDDAGRADGQAQGNFGNEGGGAGVNPQNTGSFASSRSSDAGAYDGPYRSHGETSNTPWWGQDSSSSSTAGGGAGDTETDAGDTSITTQAPGDAPYYGYQPHGAKTPQFFSNVEAPSGDDGNGFLSPMDAFSPMAGQQSFASGSAAGGGGPQPRHFDDEDEEDDLGLGNNSSRKAKERSAGSGGGDSGKGQNTTSPSKKEDDKLKIDGGDSKKPELRPSASTSSWLGRLWGRGSTEPENKPKKVHLGEEKTSFYYDKELKRWVNKGSGDSGASATSSPPPPPRAQTASPSVQNGRLGPPGARYNATDHSLSSSTSSGFLRGFGAPSSSSGSIAEEGDYGDGSPPPPPMSSQGYGRSGSGLGAGGPSLGLGGVPAPPRARSNLGDPSVPPAAQPPPPMRPASSMMGGAGGGPPPPMARGGSAPPPMGGAGGTATPPPGPPGGSARAGGASKKKPIKARYVVVD